jgi:hypothetical protein
MNFANSVCYTDYYPASAAQNSPSCKGNPSSVEIHLLSDAFGKASSKMQQQLCHLEKVYININSKPNNLSWGVWNPSSMKGNIAISQGTINNSNDLGQEENGVLHAILPNLSNWDADPNPSLPPPKYGPIPNTPELAVLSQIAHELGHVLFYDANVAGFKNRTGPSSNCYSSRQGIFKTLWNIPNTVNARKWVIFNDENHLKHKDGKNISDINNSIGDYSKGTNDYSTASSELDKIVGGDFASVFAAVSPEEDFVETYKALALQDAGVATLKFSYNTAPSPTKTVDFLSYLGNSTTNVYTKVACINSLGIAP